MWCLPDEKNERQSKYVNHKIKYALQNRIPKLAVDRLIFHQMLLIETFQKAFAR